MTTISDEHIKVIKHARKSLLFNNNKTWVKRENESLFDVTMGSYDGAEICELVGLYILSQLKVKLHGADVGLYRDDGLVLLIVLMVEQPIKHAKIYTNYSIK